MTAEVETAGAVCEGGKTGFSPSLREISGLVHPRFAGLAFLPALMM